MKYKQYEIGDIFTLGSRELTIVGKTGTHFMYKENGVREKMWKTQFYGMKMQQKITKLNIQ